MAVIRDLLSDHLKTGGATETDEFSEKFQNWGYHFQSQKLECIQTGFFEHEFEEKIALWFSENEEGGGAKGLLEVFRKSIRFDVATRTLKINIFSSFNSILPFFYSPTKFNLIFNGTWYKNKKSKPFLWVQCLIIA